MKFIVDMPVGASVAAWLRDQGHDAIHALEAGLDRSEDDAIVDFARQQGRVVITLDLDYPRLIALSGDAAPGLILFRDEGLKPAEICTLMARIFATLSPAEISESITVATGDALRMRKLPI
jgi:predicted nuclease of predicted toxin-antitoxin system